MEILLFLKEKINNFIKNIESDALLFQRHL
jgi:hypothetical protein